MQRETLDIWARLGRRGARRGARRPVAHRSHLLPRPGAVRASPCPNDAATTSRRSSTSARPRSRRCSSSAWRSSAVRVQWGRRLTGVRQGDRRRGAYLRGRRASSTPAYVVGADGAHSAVRRAIGLSFDGHTFEDRFLIADVRADLPFPHERRFYFDPPWNPGRQVLIHPQPDDVWRIDWQVPPDTDADAELANGGLERRIRAVIGPHDPVRAGVAHRLSVQPAPGAPRSAWAASSWPATRRTSCRPSAHAASTPASATRRTWP